MKKFINGMISLIMAAGLGIFILIYPPASFFESEGQKAFFASLERELGKGRNEIKLEELLPAGDWDKICLIQPYAFDPKFSEQQRIGKYYGNATPPWRLFLPDPFSERFIYGFVCIKNSEIVCQVYLQSTTRFSWPGGFNNYSPYFLKDRRRISPLDLNIKKGQEEPCLERENAYLSFPDEYTILISKRMP